MKAIGWQHLRDWIRARRNQFMEAQKGLMQDRDFVSAAQLYQADELSVLVGFCDTILRMMGAGEASYTYVIPRMMKSLNTWSRQHWSKVRANTSGEKRIWEQMIWGLVNEDRDNKPPEPIQRALVEIVFQFPDHDVPRDPDNFSAKWILDGLRKAGVLVDDTFRNVTVMKDAEFVTVAPEDCCTKITVIPLQQADQPVTVAVGDDEGDNTYEWGASCEEAVRALRRMGRFMHVGVDDIEVKGDGCE